MLRQRIITGLIIAAVVIGVDFFATHFWFNILIAAILLLASRELLLLTIKSNHLVTILLSTVFAAGFLFSIGLVNPSLIHWQALTGSMLWLAIALSLSFYRPNGKWSFGLNFVVLLFSLSLLWICGHSLIYLHHQFGPWMFLYLLSLVAFADIGAYFGGRRFGKRKLAPAISPGKTWEGVFGGVVINLFWMLVVYQLADGWGMTLLQFVILSVATSMISVVGDLFESVLKREAGAKDSGNLLPGHGGVLDRVDGLVPASPVFILGVFQFLSV